MRLSPTWLPASLLLLALGCSKAGAPADPPSVPVTIAGGIAVPPASPDATPPRAPNPVPSGLEPRPAGASWLAFGDSLTQDAFGKALAWHEVLGPEGPAPVNAGVWGDTTTSALARLDRVLAEHPEARYVGLAFGTNDAWGRMPVDRFREQLQAMIDRVRAAGKVPVLATIPYSPESELAVLPDYNRAILALQAANGLPAGPDLYRLVQANEGYLQGDGVHMTPEGSQAIQRAWAEVAARLAW
jgi:lysophospholipase L1-like esterase